MEVAMVLELQMDESARNGVIQDIWSHLNNTCVFCRIDTIGVAVKDSRLFNVVKHI